MNTSVSNATPPKGGVWSPRSGLYKGAAHAAHRMPPVGGMAICLFVLISTLLSSCAEVQDTYAPDGRKAYALDCSLIGWDECLKAAGDKCGSKGYDILDRTSEGNHGELRSMLVACKRHKSEE